MRTTRWVLVWAVGAAAVLAGCGASGGDASDATTTSPKAGASTTAPKDTSTTATTALPTTAPPTTAAPTTPPDPPTTAAPVTTPPAPATTAAPAWGSPCALGSSPDCIDPDEDGQGVLLQGGGRCMAEMAPMMGPGICSDLDGDTKAGYPDGG